MLTRINVQLDKLDEKLDNVDKTLIRQEESLKEHMRRTELLERHYESLQSELHNEVEPIKEHVQQVKGIAKFLSVALPIIAAAAAGLKYLL